MKIRALIPARRWLIRLGVIAAAGVAMIVGLSIYLDWRAKKDWAEACAEADRLDPGWRWENLVASNATGRVDHDAAEIVATAATRVSSLWPKNRSAFARIGMHSGNRRLAPTTASILERRLVDASDLLAELDRIRTMPRGRIAIPAGPLLNSTWSRPLESVDVVRELLFPRLALRAENGDVDGALGDFRLMLLVAQPAADAPFLMHNLVAAADRTIAVNGLERVLAQGESSAAALEAARRMVEIEGTRPPVLAALRGERAGIEDILHALDDGRLARDDVAKSGLFADPVQLTGWKTADDLLNRTMGTDLRRSKGLSLLRHLTQLIEWLKESPDGLKIHEAEWDVLRSRMTGAAKLLANNLVRHVVDAQTAYARLRCAAAALAAEQFRRETGHWPTALNDLAPKYLTAVPRDPFDLQPIRLARRPDGIVIYSIGTDSTDEGGAIASDGAAKPTDIGVRLWDVDKRRQPPLPAQPSSKQTQQKSPARP